MTYRVLMFAPNYAPYFFSEALVNSKLALAMLKQGWDITVITAPSTGYTYSGGWEAPWEPLKSTRVEISTHNRSNVLSKIKSKICATMRGADPIPSSIWAAMAADEALRRHKEEPFDFVLTRSTSCIAHLPAMIIRKEMQIPWIANYNDPPEFMKPDQFSTQVPYWQRTLALRYLRRSAAIADWCVFPSDRLRDYMLELLALPDAKKTAVIPHIGLELPNAVAEVKAPPPSTERFCVTHAGSILAEHEPREFFEAWHHFVTLHSGRNPCLQIIGVVDPEIEALIDTIGIRDSTLFLGSARFVDTLCELAGSSVQLIIDRRHHGTLMLSKIPDYAAVGRPIIAISSANSTTRDMIEGLGAGYWAENSDIDAICSILNNSLEDYRLNTGSSLSVQRLQELTSPDSVLQKIERLVESVAI